VARQQPPGLSAIREALIAAAALCLLPLELRHSSATPPAFAVAIGNMQIRADSKQPLKTIDELFIRRGKDFHAE